MQACETLCCRRRIKNPSQGSFGVVTLVVQAAESPRSLGVNFLPQNGPIRRAWDERKPQIGHRASLSPEGLQLATEAGATVLLAVPIRTAERAWGLLITLMQRPPVFPQDDLSLLELYSEQTALALEQNHLLDEQDPRNI